MNTKLSVTILTGFLGSGKTTLLNNLLEQFADEKNIVIENEFGKINIDATLISEKYDSIFELTNGCICCSLNNKLLDVLQEIVNVKKEVTNIFIETTGIADVGEINAIFTIPLIANHFNLKKTICIVDAQSYEKNSSEVAEINRQIVSSDLIVLNKTENLSPIECIHLKELIQRCNPFADITLAVNSKIDMKLLSLSTSEKIQIQSNPNKTPHEIRNVLYESDAYFDLNLLKYTIFKTLFLSYHQLYRIKGYVKTTDNSVYLIQSVGKSVTATLQSDKHIDISQLVVIGKELTTEAIKRLINTAIAKPIQQLH